MSYCANTTKYSSLAFIICMSVSAPVWAADDDASVLANAMNTMTATADNALNDMQNSYGVAQAASHSADGALTNDNDGDVANNNGGTMDTIGDTTPLGYTDSDSAVADAGTSGGTGTVASNGGGGTTAVPLNEHVSQMAQEPAKHDQMLAYNHKNGQKNSGNRYSHPRSRYAHSGSRTLSSHFPFASPLRSNPFAQARLSARTHSVQHKHI